MGRLQLEIRSFRRADAPLPETHGPEALQVPNLRALIRTLRPLGVAHEEAPAQEQVILTSTNGALLVTTSCTHRLAERASAARTQLAKTPSSSSPAFCRFHDFVVYVRSRKACGSEHCGISSPVFFTNTVSDAPHRAYLVVVAS